ncbi:large ribosomal subunit protein mL45-like [Clavelina lepadiformis]|uniref:large ribosomal subunit protein mL45-like n=1 Tax=Clavelina lepadiformis TaxID=159417 RepID=UPI0040424774
MLTNIVKQACQCGMTRIPAQASQSIITIHVRYKGNAGQTPHTREQLEKLGLSGYMKKYRQYAQYNYQEWRYPQKSRAIDISCTRQIIDQYNPEEGGFKSFLNSPREKLKPANMDAFHNRIIKKRVQDYHRKRFPPIAQEIYVDTHNLLNTENWTVTKKLETEEKLDKMVTPQAYPDMIKGLNSKTVIWKYDETIEPPKVVRVRSGAMLEQSNLYGQVTVRFHSKQTLAIYDRFGRLMFGDPESPRNVLEYVVFERHISHPYGLWRIHGKLPGDAYEREPARRTVAIIKPNQRRVEAKEWQDAEDEACVYKWYPARHKVMQKIEGLKRMRRGHEYWKKRRKYVLFNIKRASSPKMRSRSRRVVKMKRNKLFSLREEGKLPPVPSHRDPDKYP